jgi:hypothetical protein
MTPQERRSLIAERNAAFERAAHEYYIQCAERAVKLAPLPEVHRALYALKEFDSNPSQKNRSELSHVYKIVKKMHGLFQYNAVSCVLQGLQTVIYQTLHKPDEVGSWSTVQFAEARFCAVRDAVPHSFSWDKERCISLSEVVLRSEHKVQSEVFDKAMGAFHQIYKNTPQEFINSKKEAANV